MKKVILLFGFIHLMALSIAQPVVERPGATFPTALIVVIDKETYRHTKSEVLAYKKMLEDKEQLSVFVVSDDWKSPDAVAAEIRKLAKQKPAPEGVVLIGNIPVVMVRNGQHTTTAFKMHETGFPIQQSSVASDRFYDDFDLKFRFLHVDDSIKNWFYYEMDEYGPQHIQSDIYSSRIMSHKAGDAAYEDIRLFLRKAVDARRTRGPLRQMTAFTGSAYNSESMTSWMDEGMALRELFPVSFTGFGARVLNFRMDEKMKFPLFTELQRPGTDLLLFTEHGAIETQYINNAPSGSDRNFFIRNLRAGARQALRNAVKQGKDTAALKKQYNEEFWLDNRWFAGALDNDSLRIADSLIRGDQDIQSFEIANLRLEPKLVIFDACYNGSFHHPGNVSAAYIFNPGKTLVAHGNTVNVLQDKWTLEHIGLMNHGFRAGTWSMLTNTLETSLSGDPTWRFSSDHTGLNEKIISEKNNAAFWLSFLSKQDAILQSMALKQLARMNYKGINDLLVQTFLKSPSANVRMQCLRLLSSADHEYFSQIIPDALKDPYELIRRKTASWVGKSGHHEYIPLLVGLALERPLDDRVIFSLERSLEMFEPTRVQQEIRAQFSAANHIYGREQMMHRWLTAYNSRAAYAVSTMATIGDVTKSLDSRIMAARSLRNSTYHHEVPQLIRIAGDKTQPVLLRQNIIEALGWFSNSYQKKTIIDFCRQVLKDEPKGSDVANEAQQTITRLTNWTLH